MDMLTILFLTFMPNTQKKLKEKSKETCVVFTKYCLT